MILQAFGGSALTNFLGENRKLRFGILLIILALVMAGSLVALPVILIYGPSDTARYCYEELIYSRLVREFSIGCHDDFCRIQRIMDFAVRQVRLATNAGEIYPFEAVLMPSRGDCYSKAALFVTLAQQAGISAGMVVIMKPDGTSPHTVCYYMYRGIKGIADPSIGWLPILRTHDSWRPATLDDIKQAAAFVNKHNKIPHRLGYPGPPPLDLNMEPDEVMKTWLKYFHYKTPCKIQDGYLPPPDWKKKLISFVIRGNLRLWGNAYLSLVQKLSKNRGPCLFSRVPIPGFYQQDLITARLGHLMGDYHQAAIYYKAYYDKVIRFLENFPLEQEESIERALYWTLLLKYESGINLPKGLETLAQNKNMPFMYSLTKELQARFLSGSWTPLAPRVDIGSRKFLASLKLFP
jgi:hypothetical protein